MNDELTKDLVNRVKETEFGQREGERHPDESSPRTPHPTPKHDGGEDGERGEWEKTILN